MSIVNVLFPAGEDISVWKGPMNLNVMLTENGYQSVMFKSESGFRAFWAGFGFGFESGVGIRDFWMDTDSARFRFEVPGFRFRFEMLGFAHH